MADLHRRVARLERMLAHPCEGPKPPQVIHICGGLPVTAADPRYAYVRDTWLECTPSEPTDAFEVRALERARNLRAEFLIFGGLPPQR
jgi:hypothetical protein